MSFNSFFFLFAYLVIFTLLLYKEAQADDQFCTSDSSCGPNSVCSSVRQRCICKLGYIFDTEQICIPHHCRESSDCEKTFGNYSHCYEELCQCSATSGIILDPTIQKCATVFPLIGQYCSPSSNASLPSCGVNAQCIWGKCQCQFGYAPVRPEGQNCDRVVCTTADECTRLEANSECTEWGWCNCKEDYILNYQTQSCQADKSKSWTYYLILIGSIVGGIAAAVFGCIIFWKLMKNRRRNSF